MSLVFYHKSSHLGSVHLYFGGGGLGKMGGDQKSFRSLKGGGAKKLSSL